MTHLYPFWGTFCLEKKHVLRERNSPWGIHFTISRIQTVGFVPSSNPIMSLLEKTNKPLILGPVWYILTYCLASSLQVCHHGMRLGWFQEMPSWRYIIGYPLRISTEIYRKKSVVKLIIEQCFHIISDNPWNMSLDIAFCWFRWIGWMDIGNNHGFHHHNAVATGDQPGPKCTRSVLW